MSTSTETIVVPFKVTVWNSDPENPDNVIVGHEKLFLDVLDDKVQALNMDGWRTNPEADSEYQSGDTTLFVDQYEKDRHVVLLLNEHELCHIGCVTLTFFSNSREALERFGADFNFDHTSIEENAAVQQTL